MTSAINAFIVLSNKRVYSNHDSSGTVYKGYEVEAMFTVKVRDKRVYSVRRRSVVCNPCRLTRRTERKALRGGILFHPFERPEFCASGARNCLHPVREIRSDAA